MPNTPLAKSMFDLLSHISLPAAEAKPPELDPYDPTKRLATRVEGAHAVLDGLLAEVEDDLLEGRNEAAATALGLAGTRISLDAMRGAPQPAHVEWLAAHLRVAAQELGDQHPAKALKAVRRARIALPEGGAPGPDRPAAIAARGTWRISHLAAKAETGSQR